MPEYSGEFKPQPFPIIGGYNRQRFTQWSPEDAANWYVAPDEDSKNKMAMYPCLGRKHVNYLGINRLIFSGEARGIFKTVNFMYVVVGSVVYRVDRNYGATPISGDGINTNSGKIVFTSLTVASFVFACFADNENIYIYQEVVSTLQVITDSNAPGVFIDNGRRSTPGFIAAFGNRIGVSVANSSEFVLSAINLVGNGASNPPGLNFDPNKCFTNFNTPRVFAQENGIIRQMGVLNNTLYIFCDYTTGIWSNSPAVFSGTGTTFPWKKNSTTDWNYGIANYTSLDIDFGILAFLAQNSDGLLQFMYSTGGQPNRMSSKAIDTLAQKYINELGAGSPLLTPNSNGFLYQYENTIFYRFSGGQYMGSGLLDQQQRAVSLEYSFESEKWERCIELNGERNRVHLHVYFNFKHLVSVIGENTIYDMSGQYYFNEVRNPAQLDEQEDDAYLAYPIRYERNTPIIYQEDYSEFETEYVQIDFVFGDSDINYSSAPFQNTVFVIAEQPDSNGKPQYIIAEQTDADGQPVYVTTNDSNYPTILDKTYNYLYNPSIELFFSDDGGISFQSADVREFSQMGVYTWRMRWYQLGCSRNRVYRLVCVSAVPIVVLGGSMNVRRSSGGAN